MKELEQLKMLSESIARIEEGFIFPETGRDAIAKGYRAASPKEYATGEHSGFTVMLKGQWYGDLDGALSDEEWRNFFGLSWAKYGTDGMGRKQLEQLANKILDGSADPSSIDKEIAKTYDEMMSAHGASDDGYEALDRYSDIYGKYADQAEYDIDKIIAMCSPQEKKQLLDELGNCFPDTMF